MESQTRNRSSSPAPAGAVVSGSPASPGPSHPGPAPWWQSGRVETPVGPVPRVVAGLTWRDRVEHWRARWGIGRMSLTIAPGLYSIGDPTERSPVLVTANYKMSFDRVRAELGGRDLWLLVLDTRGINVWCAAGKGTFGTEELMRRAAGVRLAEVVAHRRLILPQLGAPGVSAHTVRTESGWRIVYGPIRATDLPAYLDAGLSATPEMRRVHFPLRERLALVPVELVMGARYLLLASACLVLLAGWGSGGGYDVQSVRTVGLRSVLMLLVAYLAGGALAPALLPWLPGRAFSAKGACVGLLAFVVLLVTGAVAPGRFENWAETGAWFLLLPVIASFLAMNFTGASTYTSLSGVRHEMRVAVPLQVVGAVAGLGLWIAGRFI